MNEAREGSATLLAPMGLKKLFAAAGIGLAIGAIVWGLGYIVNTYVMQVLFCPGTQTMRCDDFVPYAHGIAGVIGAGIGLFGLIKLRVLRPLLVILAAAAALWNLPSALSVLPWLAVGVATVIFYAGVYALFSWVARIRSLWAVAAIFTVAVIAIRLALVS